MPQRSLSSAAFAAAPPAHGLAAGPAEAPAIDFAHLARQSLGDQSLEVELLQLFDRQAARIVAEIGMPDLAGGARSERLDLAHTLKGSARAVGAWDVGEACEAYEAALKADGAAATVIEAAARLRRAVAAARALIAETTAG
ncbi:MAG: Hpt domain-containing protein [Methylobacteriaceae bacterium]|nr:Hpt domain-containing protein [Methylobacteriaceae bacterium]